MAYGLDRQLYLEDGPASHAAAAAERTSGAAFRAWRGLDRERRLALVEKALRPPANDDLFDGYPAAL